MSAIKAAFFTGNPGNIDYVYGKGRRELVARETELYPEVITPENFHQHREALTEVEVIFSTWGFWAFSEEEFAAMPHLKAVFYSAGATDYFARPFLARGIEIFSAWQANAIPVAEYCTAQIVLAMKGFFRNTREYTGPEMYGHRPPAFVGPGNYGETVALIGAGAIATRTRELLKPYHLNVLVVPSRAERRTVSLEEAFRTAFVISNHLPNREDNRGVLNGDLFRLMRPGAVFINTGRGAQVNEADLVTVFRSRPDLTALLDVTDPEPPAADSELYRLPNVQLTGHIAGSLNDEVVRMADYMLEEFRNWRAGAPTRYRITPELLMTN